MRWFHVVSLIGLLLHLACGGGSSASPQAGPSAPTAAFTCTPTTPTAGQSVQFQDASTSAPTSWSWNFGDGGTSTSQHPSHTFAAADTYTVTLIATNSAGAGTSTKSLSVSAVNSTPPEIGIVLGCPTANSVKASLFSPSQSGKVYLEYGRSTGVYSSQTTATDIQAGTPLVLTLETLSADAQYYYRLGFMETGETSPRFSSEYRFHTARPTGASFTFDIQADPHLDENSSLEVYQTTLGNALADAPDFFMDLGDTFMCEKHTQPFDATVKSAPDWATVEARYRYERGNYGLLTHSAPLFLVNGNHEGEAGWLLNGTSQNLAVWATQARQKYFLNPLPNGFYSGDTTIDPYVGQRAAYYAWTWGNALFVVLDPYWNTKNPGTDGWGTTLGKAQYDWLAATLASSTATFKFVFIHNLVSGVERDGLWRGGIEATPFGEWGGKSLAGVDEFAAKRPGWAMPIHALLVKHGVSAVFHGHDHLYAKQDLDGIVYQEVPQPSARSFLSGTTLADQYGYTHGTILSAPGHLRVSVDATHATVQYVRAYVPASETETRKNRQVDDTWVVAASGWPTAAFTMAPTAPLVGQAIAFADASTGTPSSWAWTFGDGATSTLQNPTHTFATAGTYAVALTARNATGSHTFTRSVVVSAGFAPAAAFGFAPATPTAGQSIAFTDTSANAPTGWSWDFGDGSAKSTQRNPTHTYAAAGSFTVALKATNAFGSTTKKQTLVVQTPNAATTFNGSVVLGCPTRTSIKVNVLAPSQSGSVYLAYGPASPYAAQTPVFPLQAATPLEIPLEGLSADTAYVYRLYFQATGATTYSSTEEASFRTARSAGSTFTFCVQGDSHPERLGTQFDPELYRRTLLTAAADKPDFFLAIGDDFSVDTLDYATITAAQVVERYTIQRPYLGLVGRSAPLFLVNGNHEQAALYLWNADTTPAKTNNVATWAQNARNAYYPQPAPDGFYSGNAQVFAGIEGGYLRNHYAWTWGDALFVVIDPYWGSPACVDNPFDGGPKRSNLWDITHGDAQYLWLKAMLEGSSAKHKFVFAHHVMGTGRGGVELAGLYEWGGLSGNGNWDFNLHRPVWNGTPLHQLMVAHGVKIFFQGHDHIWARQQLDGVTYQTLPEPADPTYTLWNADAFLTGDKFPDTGYTRVTVSPENVKVEYVRTWLPKDEGPGKVNGTVAFSYTLP